MDKKERLGVLGLLIIIVFLLIIKQSAAYSINDLLIHILLLFTASILARLLIMKSYFWVPSFCVSLIFAFLSFQNFMFFYSTQDAIINNIFGGMYLVATLVSILWFAVENYITYKK